MKNFKDRCIFIFTLLSVQMVVFAATRVDIPDANWDYTYGYKPTKIGDDTWYYGSATFYDWSGNSGSCGYPWVVVNNTDTAAVPDPRYSDFLTDGLVNWPGAACGQCYWVKCLNVPRYYNTVFCRPGAVKVLIVDYDVPGTWNAGKWPDNHFDLQPKTFAKIAEPSAGIINIKFKRTGCPNSVPKWSLGLDSNPFWKNVVIYDVPNVGAVESLYAKPSNRNKWYKGKRSWGAHWDFLGQLNFDENTTVLIFLSEGKGALKATYVQAEFPLNL